MAIQLLTNPVFISIDGAGRTNSGGSVEVYVADGLFTTYATIYSDQVKTTELANPVTLDSAGVKEIWYDVKVDTREKTQAGGLIRDTLNRNPNASDDVVQSFNLASNGSFEVDTLGNGQPDSWTISPYTGSAIAITESVVTHGTQALEFNTAGVTTAGGTATSVLFPVTEGSVCSVAWSFYATNAATINTFVINWYDEDGAVSGAASTLTMPATGSVPTSWTAYHEDVTATAGATQGEIVITGISSASASPTAKAYFDGIIVTNADLVTLNSTQTLSKKTFLASNVKNVVNVSYYGGLPSATGAVNTAAFQAAIDAVVAAGGGVVYVPQGTYSIDGSGTSIGGREYGLLLKSTVTLEGESMYSTILQVSASQDIDFINTNRSVSQSNIGLKNLTLDGNEANQGGVSNNGFNAWLHDIDGLVVENIYSLNPANWGIRIDSCDHVHTTNIRCNHSAESNSDGIHFIDTDNVTGGNFHIKSQGDDCFVIEALNGDVKGYSLSNIYVDGTTGLANNPRGILLLSDVAVVTGAHTLSNMNLTGIVAEDCDGPGVVLDGASYTNVHIDAVVNGNRQALYLTPGNGTYAGTLDRCSFNITGADSQEESIQMVTTNGTIENNTINANVTNPADGKVGVDLEGDYWTGNINIDYDPAASKVSPLHSIDVFGSYNNLNVTVDGGTTSPNGINVRAAAIYNTFHIGSILNTATNSINILATANNNTFIGGSIDDTIVDGGTRTQFIGVTGALGNGLTYHSTSPGLTASVGSAQGGTPLTTDINEISTCANANDSVTLPSAEAGLIVTIINNGANAAGVFPAAGNDLGGGLNIEASLAAGSNITYAAYNNINWEVV